MGIKLSEVEVGSQVTFHLSKDGRKVELGATIKKHVKNEMAFIDLHYNTTKRLSFEGINIEMEYNFDGMPIVWKDVKLGTYKGEYLMQALSEGVRNNRRNCFRVGVSLGANCQRRGHGLERVLIRDISLSGFSITDRKKDMGLQIGEDIRISFEDMGHQIDLRGKVVREEECEDVTIYGLEICNLCKDLSSYVNMKQRLKRS